MAAHNDTGEQGEGIAAGYLRKKGYQILEMNWRAGSLEVDIIAGKDGSVIFVEVKTRNSRKFGAPEQSVNRRKQQLLVRAANAYMQRYGLDSEVRFDIISVVASPGGPEIDHIEQAFYPLVNRTRS